MKSIIKGVLFLTLIGTILTGCEKEETKSQETDFKLNSGSEVELLDKIKREATVKIKSKSIIAPQNTNNMYDFYGVYHQNMILSINNNEQNNPSLNYSEYNAKFSSYLAGNEYGIDFSLLQFKTSTLFESLTELIINYSTNFSANEAISAMLAIENNIFNSQLLTADQKVFLLSFTASMKYTRYTIAVYGLTIGEVTLTDIDWTTKSCFDRAFSEGAHAVYSNFADWDNPGNVAAAWLGFPVTIIAGIGNGFWHGIRC